MPVSATNRLAECISPYLRAHAHNPVAWQPWDDAALAQACERDCPILLSIGYSACHWCHVMAREAFSDPAIAEQINRDFVAIKVDREERPDLDRVYQLAHQALMARSGGWPLTVFLTPDDHMPFFAGTYFPPGRMQGMPGFNEVLAQVSQAWHEQAAAIRRHNDELQRLFAGLAISPAPLDAGPIEGAADALEAAFDPDHGGFGEAPKFPHPGPLALALTRSMAGGDAATRCRTITERSLAGMAYGGVFDQIGGGFARYSTDAHWAIPHFEKMLYDNGLLLGLYADAAVALQRDDFAATARATADWLVREMRVGGAAFGASVDAESEGEEGRFYVWDGDALADALGDDPVARAYFGFDRAPNFDQRWHPVVARDPASLATEHDLSQENVEARIDRAHRALHAARAQRVRPARDDKVLTAWNAYAIEGLAVAGRRLGEPDYVDAALTARDFLGEHLWDGERLFAVWRDGVRQQPAFLDDYAALLHALLASLEARWRDRDLAFARTLADALLTHFEDGEAGGFFQTGDFHETLPYRPKPVTDESAPSGNGLAALALDTLGHLVGEPRYVEAARATVAAAMSALERDPLAHATLVRALAQQFEPIEIVRVSGNADTVAALVGRGDARYCPGRRVFAVPRDSASGLALADEAGVAGQRCRGPQCETTVTDQASVEAMVAG